MQVQAVQVEVQWLEETHGLQEMPTKGGAYSGTPLGVVTQQSNGSKGMEEEGR